MRGKQLFCIGLIALWGMSSSAEPMTPATSESKHSLKEIIGNKRFQENKEITDLELRAQAGSLYRYSLKFTLSYAGAPVSDPLDRLQPNPDNSPGDYRSNLFGAMGLRYRLDSKSAFYASAGVRSYTPFQEAREFDVQDPGLSYDRTYMTGPVQMRSSIKANATTAEYFRQRGQVSSVGLGQAAKYTLGTSRWIVGADASLSFYQFNREYSRRDGRVSNYYLAVYPSLEYKITDKVNFNTSSSFAYSNLRRDGSWWLWDRRLVTQRVGIGAGITREVYINPYLNFYPEEFSWRTTSLSFSTVFSIF